MDLQELTHSHAFEIVLQSIADCDRLVAALKENFQVIQYQDHIHAVTRWQSVINDQA